MQCGLRISKPMHSRRMDGEKGSLRKSYWMKWTRFPKKRGKTFEQQKAMCEALYALGGMKDAFTRREWHEEVTVNGLVRSKIDYVLSGRF